ncbi:MAG: hypothetical protein ACRELB_06440 [Polyangiaceae bacterium]
MVLHHFFRLLESRPEFTVPSRLLADAIGRAAEEALCHAHVLGPSGPATWYPCARRLRFCRRTVALSADGAQAHLFCGRSSGECPAEIEPVSELGQHALNEGELVRLLQRLFGVAGQSPRSEGRGQPMLLGRTPGARREVWLWLRPDEPAFGIWMGELESRALDGLRALVLVPTSRRVHAHTFERYAPGQPVEVTYLDSALTVDGLAIVRAAAPAGPPLRVPCLDGPFVERSGVRLRVPAGVGWAHIFIEYVNGDTIAVRFGASAPVRLSAADLGLKREMDGKASQLWELLLALCLGSGTCSRIDLNAANVGVLRTRATRLSKHLCAVFNLEEPPLHVHRRTQTVRADFHARPETRRSSTRREPR